MPTFYITVNDQAVATVSTEECDILTIRIDASFDREELATLDVSGGKYPVDVESTYWTWVPERPLLAGQRVAVEMREHGASSHAGKTIAELYPDDPPCTITDFTLTDAMCDEIARRPRFRDKLAFQFASSSGTRLAGKTGADEDSLALSVLWNWTDPATASVSLHSYSLADIRARNGGGERAREQMKIGGRLAFVLGDEPFALSASL
ncbi:hypothetical protein ACFOLJ_17060 [Rugamonas sp. CCM 8940]|uniref:hypothetical protein n=1 Tax=Rugamonas sp. CCM 8940 TaxID=2765359 RepID=UPI0018F56D5A|nr:hypothetical protein [Rugamonas sp. CCM 8940]MBJ7308642.1 hypothetical protein [Rugamonas sp. CCM 8940]